MDEFRDMVKALRRQQMRLYLILNACWEPLDFELPPVGADERQPMALLDRNGS